MKIKFKIISLLTAVMVLTCNLSSCTFIKELTMSESARAIYYYNKAMDITKNMESGNITRKVTTLTSENRETEEDVKVYEISKSNYRQNDMKCSVTVNQLDGSTTKQLYCYGYTDGYFFTGEYSKNMKSGMSADEYVEYTETDRFYPDFDISTDNCASAEYDDRDGGGYIVTLTNFYSDAIEILKDWLEDQLGIPSDCISINGYEMKAYMKQDYVLMSDSVNIVCVVNYGKISREVIIKTESTYENMGEEVSVDTSQIKDCSEIRDIQSIDVVLDAYGDFMVSDDGSFELSMDSNIIFGMNTEITASVTYATDASKFSYSVDSQLLMAGDKIKITENYSDGKLTVYEDGEKETKTITDAEAMSTFYDDYKDEFKLSKSKINDVSVLTASNGDKVITIKSYLDADLLEEMFDMDYDDMTYSMYGTTFEYTYTVDSNGALKSCSMKGKLSVEGFSFVLDYSMSNIQYTFDSVESVS